eukprot:12217083-Alexandrium_andersonii.AAC.1
MLPGPGRFGTPESMLGGGLRRTSNGGRTRESGDALGVRTCPRCAPPGEALAVRGSRRRDAE